MEHTAEETKHATDSELSSLDDDIQKDEDTLKKLRERLREKTEHRKAVQAQLDKQRALTIGRLALAAGLGPVEDGLLEKFFASYVPITPLPEDHEPCSPV